MNPSLCAVWQGVLHADAHAVPHRAAVAVFAEQTQAAAPIVITIVIQRRAIVNAPTGGSQGRLY